MKGFQVSLTIHDYNNPGQKVSQKIVDKMNMLYNYSEYKNNVITKIYDNGLTRGVKINIFCKDLDEVKVQMNYLNLNINNTLKEYLPEINTPFNMPSIRIVLTKKL